MNVTTNGTRNHKSIADHPPHAIVAAGSVARAQARTLTGKVSVRQKSGPFRVFDATNQVAEDRTLSTNATSVAVRLALHVNKDHDGCSFPSVETLAGETSMCERSVRNALRELERERWILTLRSPGKRANRYRLTYGRASQPEPPNPAPRAGLPGTTCRVEPSDPTPQPGTTCRVEPPNPAPRAALPGTTCRLTTKELQKRESPTGSLSQSTSTRETEPARAADSARGATSSLCIEPPKPPTEPKLASTDATGNGGPDVSAPPEHVGSLFDPPPQDAEKPWAKRTPEPAKKSAGEGRKRARSREKQDDDYYCFGIPRDN